MHPERRLSARITPEHHQAPLAPAMGLFCGPNKSSGIFWVVLGSIQHPSTKANPFTMKHLKHFLDGFASVGNWGVEPRPYISPQYGFEKDQRKMFGDIKRVGQDMKKAYEKNGKPNPQGRS
jgi:hypothetical protein